MSSPLAALYNAAPIILWVEDLTTSFYLDTIWQHDSRIKLYVGGGHETLAALVEDERRNNGRTSLYSLRDRDFGPTNRTRWRADDTWHFALETFEAECFLLDPVALASCPVNTAAKTAAWIREHLEQQARNLLWWMSCRAVIAELREARQQKFPRHPKRSGVTCQAEAEEFLLTSDWVLSTAPGLRDVVAPERLRHALVNAHARYQAHLDTGTWTTHISGKSCSPSSSVTSIRRVARAAMPLGKTSSGPWATSRSPPAAYPPNCSNSGTCCSSASRGPRPESSLRGGPPPTNHAYARASRRLAPA